MVNGVDIINVLSTLIPILATLGGMAYWLGRRFALIEARFREMDKRFEEIDKRFGQIDRRFEEIDKRFEEMGSRFDRKLEDLKQDLKGYIDSRISRVAEAFRSYQEFFIEYLTFQGVIRSTLEADMLRNEASRIMRLATMNPLTKEEWQKIKYYLEKGELTLEEALEFRELARKVTDEYGDKPEAWKLHILASIRVGEAMRRMREEEEKRREKQERERSQQAGQAPGS